MVDININKKGTLNESDFEKLFKSNFKELCFLAQTYLKDLDTSKEIVQESFIALWEKRESIDSEKSVLSYLKSTIVNKSLNYLRDNNKFDREILCFENLIPFSGNSTGDIIIVDELKNKIDEAIRKLPEKSQKIFLLNRFENLKYKDIAKQLNISIKTVEFHMSLALKHMKEHLIHYIGILIIILFNDFF